MELERGVRKKQVTLTLITLLASYVFNKYLKIVSIEGTLVLNLQSTNRRGFAGEICTQRYLMETLFLRFKCK